jgi:hypothetical protein
LVAVVLCSRAAKPHPIWEVGVGGDEREGPLRRSLALSPPIVVASFGRDRGMNTTTVASGMSVTDVAAADLIIGGALTTLGAAAEDGDILCSAELSCRLP